MRVWVFELLVLVCLFSCKSQKRETYETASSEEALENSSEGLELVGPRILIGEVSNEQAEAISKPLADFYGVDLKHSPVIARYKSVDVFSDSIDWGETNFNDFLKDGHASIIVDAEHYDQISTYARRQGVDAAIVKRGPNNLVVIKLRGKPSVASITKVITPEEKVDREVENFLEDVYDNGWKLISGSSNLAQKAVEGNIARQAGKANTSAYSGVFRSPFRRSLQLRAMRASIIPNLDEETKELVDLVYSWNLNLQKDESLEAIPISERIVTLKNGKTMTLGEISNALRPKKIIRNFSDSDIEANALKAVKWRIGNCGNYADILYTELLEATWLKGSSIPMEIVADLDYDHLFVVVNRPPNSNLKDVSTWGEHSFIVDPWWQFFGPVSKFVPAITARLKNAGSNLRQIKAGVVGSGHSSGWPHGYTELFPGSEHEATLLTASPNKVAKENISFAE